MEIIKLEEQGIEKAVVAATHTLTQGGIVLYPTDTLYGLAVDATNEAALNALYALKGREPGKSVSVIVRDVHTVQEYGVMNEAAKELATQHLPGALTLVLPVTEVTPHILTESGTIGIRIPNDTFCLALAEVFGKPYTATSANRSGMPTGATVEEIRNQFETDIDRIALAIDGGRRDGGVGSTVVSVVSDTPTIIRQGVLTL